MNYVLYTADKALTDAEFLALGSSYTVENNYNLGPFSQVKIAENGTHRVSFFSACQSCVDDLIVPSVEFLCKKDGMDCSHNRPQDYFTAEEWAKVDLANARSLFEAVIIVPPEPLTVDVTQEDIDRVTNADIDYIFTDRDWIVVRMLKEGFTLG